MEHEHGHNNKLLAERMPEKADCEKIAAAFGQLGDATRLRIFWILCHSEQCVRGIAALMEMSSPAVAHHLKELKTAGLIVSRRVGREMYYRLGDTDECLEIHSVMDNLFHIKCFKA